MIKPGYFYCDERLWKKFVKFFREMKNCPDWSEDDIWRSMCQGDITEFEEHITQEFNVDEATQELIELYEEELELRLNSKYNPDKKEINAIRKRIAEVKTDIAHYMICGFSF